MSKDYKLAGAKLQPFVSAMSVISALLCLIWIALYYGFEHNAEQGAVMRKWLHLPQLIFLLQVIVDFAVNARANLKRDKIFKCIVDIALVLSVAAWIYPHADKPWIPWLQNILYSNTYLNIVLATYSIFELCQAVMRLVGRRTNPALMLTGSFLIFILIGSFVLMLPRCTYEPIDYCDSLFISTSAVCITGLTTVDVPSTFTPAGLAVLAVLMQIGGLGVITFTSFFAIFFSGRQSLYSQLLVKDMIYSKSLGNLIPTMLYILAFTLGVEAIGAAAIYWTVPAELGMDFTERLMFSCFHSLSSFCNAGFTCLPAGMANPTLLNSNQSIYVVTSILIFAGAIGFPILVNFKDIFVAWIKRVFRRLVSRKAQPLRRIHVYDLNTKLVLATTFSILAIGTFGFLFLEWNNSLSGFTTTKKIIQSLFNALTPRSAGFVSLSPASFLPATMILVVVQMWIGGSSQSLAGGIKVNTLAVVATGVRSIIRGNAYPAAFGRRISPASLSRAYSVLTLAIGAFVFYAFALIMLEPDIDTKSLLFEATSALFTVGSSLGATEHLSEASQLLLITAMLVGRVGILSLLAGLGMTARRDKTPHYPQDSVIIS